MSTDPRRPTMEELNQLPEFQEEEEDFEDELEGLDDEEDEDDPEDEVPDTIPEGHDRVLTFEEITAATDDEEEELYIPEWGGKVVIRGLSKREFDHMRKMATVRAAKGRRNEILEMEMTCAGLVKPTVNAQKYQMLLDRNAGAMIRILNSIYKKSGLEREAEQTRERRFPKK